MTYNDNMESNHPTKYRVEVADVVAGTPRWRCVRVTCNHGKALGTQLTYEQLGHLTRIKAKEVRI